MSSAVQSRTCVAGGPPVTLASGQSAQFIPIAGTSVCWANKTGSIIKEPRK